MPSFDLPVTKHKVHVADKMIQVMGLFGRTITSILQCFNLEGAFVQVSYEARYAAELGKVSKKYEQGWTEHTGHLCQCSVASDDPSIMSYCGQLAMFDGAYNSLSSS